MEKSLLKKIVEKPNTKQIVYIGTDILCYHGINGNSTNGYASSFVDGNNNLKVNCFYPEEEALRIESYEGKENSYEYKHSTAFIPYEHITIATIRSYDCSHRVSMNNFIGMLDDMGLLDEKEEC